MRPFLGDGPRDLDEAPGSVQSPIRHPSGVGTSISAGEGHTTTVGDPALVEAAPAKSMEATTPQEEATLQTAPPWGDG